MAFAFVFASTGEFYALSNWTYAAAMSIASFAIPQKTESLASVATADVRQAIHAASEATGVDFAYLAAEASLESGLDPAAKARTSSAAGLYQFIESTWAGMVERHGAKVGLAAEAEALRTGDLSRGERKRIMDLRFDAGVAARMGAEFAAENAEHLRDRLRREPEDVDLYLAHFLGPGGAVKFLRHADKAPDAAAADAFPAAARANRAVFYDGARARGFAEIRDRFDAKLTARANDIDAAPPAKIVSSGAPPKPILDPPAPSADETAPNRAATVIGGDPWLSTLITAQLSMNDSLARVRRDDGAHEQAFKNLL